MGIRLNRKRLIFGAIFVVVGGAAAIALWISYRPTWGDWGPPSAGFRIRLVCRRGRWKQKECVEVRCQVQNVSNQVRRFPNWPYLTLYELVNGDLGESIGNVEFSDKPIRLAPGEVREFLLERHFRRGLCVCEYSGGLCTEKIGAWELPPVKVYVLLPAN